MFWLYFARDFYRATQAGCAQALAEQSPPYHFSSCVVTVVFRAPRAKTPAPCVATQAAPSTSEPAHAATTPSSASPLQPFLQRLSVDGDHAFGIWDEDAGFSLFSANFERVTGLSSGACAGHDWIYGIHHQQQYAVNEALLNAQSGHDGMCLVQARRNGDANDWRWLMIDVKAPSRRQPGIMVLFRDLSEQKALEEALRKTESALAMSERGRAAFLSSMSHELRTPLNAIMGFSEMMKSGVFGKLDNPTYAEYAKHIHDSGSMLLGKINDLLEIASMDAGGLALAEEEFYLPHLLSELVEMHSHHAFERQQQIILDCPHPIELMGDRAKLLCAASHLITNALRHSKVGQSITLSVRVQADAGVILSVRDTGEGISDAQLEIIRSALTTSDSYYNIECGGIGLGLSLAKELTQRHGGRVMIDSMRHRGTVVSLILPTSRVVAGLPAAKRRKHLELV